MDKSRQRDSSSSSSERKHLESTSASTVHIDIKDWRRDLKRPLENLMTFSKRIEPVPSFESFLRRAENVVLVHTVWVVRKSEEKLTLVQWSTCSFLFFEKQSAARECSSARRLLTFKCWFFCGKVAFLQACLFWIKNKTKQKNPFISSRASVFIIVTKTSCVQQVQIQKQ